MKTKTTLLILLLIAGCEVFDIDYDTYIIKNKTDKTVTILAYDKYYHINNQLSKFDVPILSDSIVILPLDQYKTKKQIGEHTDPRGYFKSAFVDSVVFIFNYEKRLTYVCLNEYPSPCYNFKNPMNYRAFSEIKYNKRNGDEYIYIITQEDYENAQPY